jgi:hypothetical protein
VSIVQGIYNETPNIFSYRVPTMKDLDFEDVLKIEKLGFQVLKVS